MSKLLIVIFGPSGVGKRCILEGVALYSKLSILNCNFKKIVLYNTREIRTNETDGVDYHYCYDDFAEMGTEKVKNNKRLIAENNTKDRLKSEKLDDLGNGLFTFSVRGKDLQGIHLEDIEDGVNFLEIYDQFFASLEPKLHSEVVIFLHTRITTAERAHVHFFLVCVQ